jgi:hypothetical protein
MFRHISEVLQGMDLEGNEVNKMVNRHIHRLFEHLTQNNIPLLSSQEVLVKKQFRFLQEDFLKLIRDLQNDQHNR